MAPIKFEENIKDKLEQRVLKPSPNAWNKLSAKLEAEPKKNTSKGFWWLGIAASFVGLLIVFSFLFYGGSDEALNTPVLVEDDTDSVIETKKDLLNETLQDMSMEEPHIASENSKTETIKTNQPLVKINTSVIKNKVEEVVFTPKLSIEEKEIETVVSQKATIVVTIENNLTPEDKKVNEVVAQIQKLQEEKSTVSDAEINALLNQAQEELMAERLYNESTKTVDAELLLLQVETDLDQSFRDRVFEALKSGYQKVKTAVAERNN